MLDENAETWELWLAVKTQWRAGGMGIVGLDYPAVWAVADRMQIEVSNCVMSKIRALEDFVLGQLAKTDK